MDLYFVRHGESEANVSCIFSNRGCKHPLTEKGREQTRSLAASLRAMSFVEIIASPILRAQQTAEILAESLGLPLRVHEDLREFDVGIWEDTTYEAGGWELYKQVVRSWIVDGDKSARLEGGESFLDIEKRIKRFLGELEACEQKTPGRRILVGHAGTYRVILPYLCENLGYKFTEQIPINNTAYVHASLTDGKLNCRAWCGVTPES